MQIDLTDMEVADIVCLLRDRGAHLEWLAGGCEGDRSDYAPSTVRFLRDQAARMYELAIRLERKAA